MNNKKINVAEYIRIGKYVLLRVSDSSPSRLKYCDVVSSRSRNIV